MMMVSSSWLFVNRLPPQRSLTPGGREKLWLRRGVERPTAYEALGAAIAGVPATWTSPETDMLQISAITFVSSGGRQRIRGKRPEIHLVGRGIAEGLVNTPRVVEDEVPSQKLTCLAPRSVGMQIHVLVFH